MIKVNLIWGRDLDDLEHRSRSDISPSAFVEYETFDNKEEN